MARDGLMASSHLPDVFESNDWYGFPDRCALQMPGKSWSVGKAIRKSSVSSKRVASQTAEPRTLLVADV